MTTNFFYKRWEQSKLHCPTTFKLVNPRETPCTVLYVMSRANNVMTRHIMCGIHYGTSDFYFLSDTTTLRQYLFVLEFIRFKKKIWAKKQNEITKSSPVQRYPIHTYKIYIRPFSKYYYITSKSSFFFFFFECQEVQRYLIRCVNTKKKVGET